MRDYGNMPKIDWHDDKSTVAKIKVQISLQEPIIIRLPGDFNLTLDETDYGCEKKGDLLVGCQALDIFATLATRNDLPVLNEIGKLAHDKGQIVDIDAPNNSLVVYD